MFIVVFTRTLHWSLSWSRCIHTFLPHFTKLYSNIIFPSTPRSSEWFLAFIFSGQNVVCIWNVFRTCYTVRLTNCEAPCYALFSSLLLLPPSSATCSQITQVDIFVSLLFAVQNFRMIDIRLMFRILSVHIHIIQLCVTVTRCVLHFYRIRLSEQDSFVQHLVNRCTL